MRDLTDMAGLAFLGEKVFVEMEKELSLQKILKP